MPNYYSTINDDRDMVLEGSDNNVHTHSYSIGRSISPLQVALSRKPRRIRASGLAGAARQGDRYDASLVGPNWKNDSQDEMSNSVSARGWLVGKWTIKIGRSHPNSAAGHTSTVYCYQTTACKPGHAHAGESVS